MKTEQVIALVVYLLFIIYTGYNLYKSKTVSKESYGYIIASIGFLIHGIYMITKHYKD